MYNEIGFNKFENEIVEILQYMKSIISWVMLLQLRIFYSLSAANYIF